MTTPYSLSEAGSGMEGARAHILTAALEALLKALGGQGDGSNRSPITWRRRSCSQERRWTRGRPSHGFQPRGPAGAAQSKGEQVTLGLW